MKKIFAILASFLTIFVTTFGLSVNAYGPVERKTFTIESPADYITFNSITNNPNFGDERNFVGIRDVEDQSGIWNANDIVVQEGHEYQVRIYVHNNAASNLNLIATNVRASVNLPTTSDKSIQINGFITADNAIYKDANGNIIKNDQNQDQHSIWDQVTLNSDNDFNLLPVDGTIQWANNSVGKSVANGGTGPVQISGHNLFTNNGIQLGYDAMDGRIPGCFQYAGYLTFNVRPQFVYDQIGIEKSVAKHSDIAVPLDKFKNTNWQNTITANHGEIVDYLVTYRNYSEVNHTGVVLNDILPAGAEYIAGSTQYIYTKDGLQQGTVEASADTLTTNGLNITDGDGYIIPTQQNTDGSYKTAYAVMFSAKMPTETPCDSTTDIVNWARISANIGDKRYYNEDSATVKITNSNACPTPAPVTPVTPIRSSTPSAIASTGAGLGAIVGTGAIAYGVTALKDKKHLFKNLFRK